ncbi:metal-dependent hydrolase [Halorubrum laminariae]|uniref:Metal-dependent hydrolase n=1 Tax=Halorubrum laminariae TaxID=1433523 RepID=A0ABD6C0Y6_9EURY|nr:metal-dependent hydrolase [Halorubrum laminariae]
MDPVTHGAVAYLLYVVYAAATSRRLPARWALVPLAVGSQFPDLIDKPLAYWGVLVYGRSLAHSVFSLVVVCGGLWWVMRSESVPLTDRVPDRLRRVTPAAFTIGYAAHLLGDAWQGLIRGDLVSVRFLAYPLFGVPRSPSDDIAPWVRVLEIYREPAAAVHLEIVVAALVVFVGLRLWAARRGQWPERGR